MAVTAVLGRVGPAVHDRGPVAVVCDCLGWGAGWVSGRVAVRRGGDGGRASTFGFDGERVPYVRHPYHYTWLNERAVEVALARRVLDRHRGARVLEVGNVLGHYGPVGHEVVDKYERAPGVRNLDVEALKPGRDGPYDLVLSVSTLEHVGLDEDERDPAKPVRALDRLTGLLARGGSLVVTLPVGYNPELDAQLRTGAFAFDRLRALRRHPRRNRWAEVPVGSVWDAPYDRLLYTAHGLLVGELTV